MRLHHLQARMVDLGRSYNDPGAIRRWGVHHINTVARRFAIREARATGSCVMWWADYRDRNFAASFVGAMKVRDGLIILRRIDHNRPGAAAGSHCATASEERP